MTPDAPSLRAAIEEAWDWRGTDPGKLADALEAMGFRAALAGVGVPQEADPSAAPAAEGQRWRYFYDDYDKGTVFISTLDDADTNTIIADGLTLQQAESLIAAHNAAPAAAPAPRDAAASQPIPAAEGHRPATNEEQQPGNGLFAGCCIVDGEVWPCSAAPAPAGEGLRERHTGPAVAAMVNWINHQTTLSNASYFEGMRLLDAALNEEAALPPQAESGSGSAGARPSGSGGLDVERLRKALRAQRRLPQWSCTVAHYNSEGDPIPCPDADRNEAQAIAAAYAAQGEGEGAS